MSEQEMCVDVRVEDGLACLCLNRPEKRNAFDDRIIADLLAALSALSERDDIFALVLMAEGKHFCAGADLGWMKRMAQASYDENHEDARNLARLMETLDQFPLPVITCVQGAAFGGAVGLIACSDIVIAQDDARFCLSEVKLGLAPATISPYVVKALGERQCRRLFLTAEVFTAEDAYRMGFVHQVVPGTQMQDATDVFVKNIRDNGPKAVKAAKALIHDLARPARDYQEMTSRLIAELRVSEEGQEGLSAFFDKRSPTWRQS